MADNEDNCLGVSNSDQAVSDGDGVGDGCGPQDLTQDLITDVESLGLPNGVESSLTSLLDAPLRLVNRGNTNAARNQSNAFINSVEDRRGNQLTNEQADQLIAATQGIIDSL